MKCPVCNSDLVDQAGAVGCYNCDRKKGIAVIKSDNTIESPETIKEFELSPGDELKLIVKKSDGSESYIINSKVPVQSWFQGPNVKCITYKLALGSIMKFI